MQNMASPPLAPRVTHSFASPSKASTAAVTIPAKTSGKSGTLVPSPDDDELPTGAPDAKPASGKGSGKKRQTTFTCESCSKVRMGGGGSPFFSVGYCNVDAEPYFCHQVYRHPSCLIKHRWEHSPHWREASKFVLSKHQQVQLLEAAAILSHMSTSPSGSSLPEDRSLWPSFLSGGMLPPPVPTTPSGATPTEVGLTSSSMPSTTMGHFPARAPRMHDYALPPDVGSQGSITQLRPGLLGVPTGSSRGASPALDVRDHYRRTVGSEGVDGWAAPYSSSVPVTAASLRSSAVPELLTPSQSYASTAGTGGWSLPRSDLRSSSGGSSGARSRSGSMESEEVDIEGEGYYNAWRRAEPVKEEDEDGIHGDWAGMDMDMD
jgi:hypothetical protein